MNGNYVNQTLRGMSFPLHWLTRDAAGVTLKENTMHIYIFSIIRQMLVRKIAKNTKLHGKINHWWCLAIIC